MTLVTIRNLGLALSSQLFSNLSFSVNAGDRIGVVAANGRGKSTLFRLIAGALEPGEGDIARARGLKISHVEQDISPAFLDLGLYDLVLGGLSGDQQLAESWRVDIVLQDLGVPEGHWQRPMRTLSGGWQRLALLARAWVSEPDMLLLDEPTNHLDLGKIALLERWLNGLSRDVPVLLASHDRAFLDAVTNRSLFLRPEQSRLFSLPYSPARAALEEADAANARRFERDIKTAEQLRRQAAKLHNIGVNSGSDLLVVKTKQLKQRAEKLEEAAKPAHLELSAGTIRLGNRGTHAKVLLTLENVAVATPDGRTLFNTGQQFVCQGDRIVLLGLNGTGKTQLVKMLRQAIEHPDTIRGGIKVTPSLALGYGDQALADLDDRETPHSTLTRRFDISDQRARTLLAGAGFAMEMQSRPVARLSGGQKARLGLLVLRLLQPNFYLLDEPTNHLDIEGQETLEAELEAHQASCLIVSHDRSFVRAVGNRFWQIDRRKLVEVDGPETFFRSIAEAQS